MLVWIHLPNLPLHFWSPNSISKIVSVIGKPLFLDERYANSTVFSFVRVCIEISANKPLLNSVMVEVDFSNNYPLEQTVECETVIKIFSSCNIFGHFAENCSNASVLTPTVRALKKPTAPSLSQIGKYNPNISNHPGTLVSEI